MKVRRLFPKEKSARSTSESKIHGAYEKEFQCSEMRATDHHSVHRTFIYTQSSSPRQGIWRKKDEHGLSGHITLPEDEWGRVGETREVLHGA